MELSADLLFEILQYLDNRTKIYLLSSLKIFGRYKSDIWLTDQTALTQSVYDTPYYDRFTNLVVNEKTQFDINRVPLNLTHLNIPNIKTSFNHNFSLNKEIQLGVGDRTKLLEYARHSIVSSRLDMTFVEKINRTILLNNNNNIISTVIVLETPQNFQNMVIKNLRMTHQNFINNIEIYVAGYHIEEIEYNFFEAYRHLLNINDPLMVPFGILSNGSFLPFLLLHTIHIIIKINCGSPNIDSELSYEIHKINNIDISSFQTNFSHVNELQYMSIFSLTIKHDFTRKYRVCIKENTTHLAFWFDDNITLNDPILNDVIIEIRTLYNKNNSIIIRPIYKKFNNCYIITFSDSNIEYGICGLNNYIILHVKTQDPHCSMHISELKSNIVSINAGLKIISDF